MVTRRGVLAGGAAVAGAGASHAGADPVAEAAIAQSLQGYLGFGGKPSGS